MATRNFDVVILGGGNAGLGVTVATREAGLKVALFEPDLLGGTCPNRGCMPKKVLVAAGHALDEIERAGAHKIAVGRPSLDWAALIDREKAMISGIPASLGALMERRGVEVIRQRGRLAGPNTVATDGESIEARHIVIASGSTPRRLPFTGAELMITSDEVLSERSLPASVVFVGGGVIALEFSHVYARAGVKVTILEALPQILPNMDADAVAQLRSATERIGVAIHTGVEIQRIELAGDRLRVIYGESGSERAIETDRVVNGAGRVPNVDGLDLAAGQVAADRGHVALDEHLRSASNPGVYVCGDAVGSTPQLSPIATYQGRIVGRNIVEGPSHTPDYASIPSCVFTVPALASVGLTQAAAEEKGIELRVSVNDMHEWLSGRTYAENTAWAKILVDAKTDHVVAAHLVGHAGEELINLFGLAIKHGITAEEIRDFVYGFPTFAADIKSML
ncbi:MAG: NAD(P)/FAD-dependent oxidoreductase [Alphaproteobacteria bacterium]|nr:NAD(P)/FAD-dependent oxidoreductase [Alphaproteobacteria bacterium]